MAGIGVLAGSIATCATCFFTPPSVFKVILYFSLNAFIILALFLANKFGRHEAGSALMLAVTGLVFTPLLYFSSGGVRSGITSFIIMIVIFMFFMLHGKRCVVMVSLEMAMIGLCMYLEHAFPHLVKNHLATQTEILNDNGQAIIIVSLFIGLTVKFQAYLYEREREKAEAASSAKSDFLATMSHEIRTPLNAIIGLSEIQLQRELPVDTYSDIEKIYNSGASLLGIINDILDISKIETGNLELIPIEYETPNLINDAVQLNIVRIGSKPIDFELSIDPDIPSSLYGDETRVRQILNNLLSNSFKYTEKGRVSLRVTCRRENRQAVLTFAVSDTGVGIKHADIGKLFYKYTQLDTRANRKIEGTGLGLSITKKLL
ncbi:MAG: hypothetical protein LBU26_01040, partial [Synergistaceae bacterium]|nr:hypothetical protein [Synergistaceae bacterium]